MAKQTKKFSNSLDIPNIKEVIKATIENRKKRADDKFANLLEMTLPFHQEMLLQIDKAVEASINSCCIKKVPAEVALELKRQYSNENYTVMIDKDVVKITWPES